MNARIIYTVCAFSALLFVGGIFAFAQPKVTL